ncbi:hypothetical protein Hanom_Chr08g00759121 [Helianthus anomalus]
MSKASGSHGRKEVRALSLQQINQSTGSLHEWDSRRNPFSKLLIFPKKLPQEVLFIRYSSTKKVPNDYRKRNG